jgi:putative transposase
VLKAQGLGVGRRRISRLMTAHGLHPKTKRRFVPRTTHSNHSGPIAANLLQQRGAPPARINEIWVKDITYIPTGEGGLYLDATLDLCSRRVLGWHASASMPTQLVINSLRQAYRSRGVPPARPHRSHRSRMPVCQRVLPQRSAPASRHPQHEPQRQLL